MQHLIVYTSEFAPLKDNAGWLTNAAHLLYNIGFGYGLMNADALVAAALNWTNVPPARFERALNERNYEINGSNASFMVRIDFDFI